MNTKPIVTIRMSAAAFDELHSCEYGSYEDNIMGDEGRTDGYDKGELHIIELLERMTAKTVCHLYTTAEVDEFFAQTVSGTFSLYHLGICQRVYRELEPFISDEMKASWICKSPSMGF